MAEDKTIPDLPAFLDQLSGDEPLESVKGGESVHITTQQVADLAGAYVREEPMQISVGGAAAGSVFAGTIQDALDKILYPEVAPTLAYSISPSLAEKGTTVTEITHTASIDDNGKTITNRKLQRNSADVTTFGTDSILYAESVSLTFASSGGQRTSVLSFDWDDDGTPTEVSSSKVLTFAAPAFHGVGSAGAGEVAIESLTKVVKTTKGLTALFSPTNQRYIYAWPQSQGAITSIKDPNNFEVIGSFTLTTATFTLADGVTTELMNVLISNSNTSQSNFQLIFS